jgi:hypothetical protein
MSVPYPTAHGATVPLASTTHHRLEIRMFLANAPIAGESHRNRRSLESSRTATNTYPGSISTLFAGSGSGDQRRRATGDRLSVLFARGFTQGDLRTAPRATHWKSRNRSTNSSAATVRPQLPASSQLRPAKRTASLPINRCAGRRSLAARRSTT